MTFYEKILLELEYAPQSLSTVYDYAFRFQNEALFEWDENGIIHSITYGAAKMRIEAASAALAVLLADYPKGSPVGIYLPNGIDWVISFWSILRSGYRPLLLNTNAPADAVESCLLESGAHYLLSEKEFPPSVRILPSRLQESSALKQFDPTWADEIILCTSGTTGKPRLIVFDGKAVLAQILNSGYVLKNNRTIASFYHGHLKLLAFLPFYHIFGLSAVLLWFSCFGRTFVLLPSLSPESISRTCRLHEVTHIFALPLFWNTVTDSILRTAKRTGQEQKLEKGLKLSLALQNSWFPRAGRWIARNILFKSVQEQALGRGVRFCISGGGALRSDTLRLINGIGYPLYNGYGMTEIGIASVELRHKASERMEGSIGKLFPSLESRFSSDSLWVRGFTCYNAFYENGKRIERNPMDWFDTKDCIEQQPNGYLYFSGRQDDMLNGENGERISPAYLESVFGCSQISQLCAVMLSLPSGTVKPVLIVEPRQRNSYALGTLSEDLYSKNEKLPSSYRVAEIYYSEEPLPLSTTMKVQASELKKCLAAGTIHLRKASRPEGVSTEALYQEGYEEILPRILEIFRSVSGVDSVSPNSHFRYDLGGDSLLYFSLVEQISEAFSVSIDLSSAPELNTPSDFAAYLLKESD